MTFPPVSPFTESQPILMLERVSKTFRAGVQTVTALEEISFRVRPGTIAGLIGPDGAGKTTIMRLIAGLLQPDSGSLRVLGIDVVQDPLAVQALIGYMPQHFGLYEDLTVRENLDLYAELRGLMPAERATRYEEFMGMTGLSPFTERLAGKLSGGMKQKLGLACTLVQPPRLLLLDEPTVGVDPVSRRELWDIIQHLIRQKGMTVLLSTAYLDEAERCHDVVLMNRGRVMGQGDPASFSSPMTGRTFLVGVAGRGSRKLQERVSRTPGITDTVLQGGKLRIVTEQAGPPDLTALGPDMADVQISAVPPRFEDSFVAMLGKKAGISPTDSDPVMVTAKSLQNEKVIVVRDVKRRFGDFYAVKGVSFDVGIGEVFGLLGANGAGKSTMFRMLCGLLPASEGILQVAGLDLRRAAATARARIGYMAQHFSLYTALSVRENLLFFSSAYGLRGKMQRERIDWVMQEFDLAPFAKVSSGDLPLGYKQRLSLAATLMHSPEILFLDEPTSGVDPLARREFWHRINILAEGGVTVLVTTHFMEEAEYCDRLVIMSQGKILAQGTPEEMRTRIRTPSRPEPSMEDVFIELIETWEGKNKEAMV
jgi:ABC-2 type transport system ATP-binding protein